MISRDPKHSYYAAGIYYAYDAASGVYTGRSLGRGDAFTYHPTPFAQWYRYNDDFVTMQTLVEFGGSALVIFYGQDSSRRDCVPDTTKLAFARDRGSLASGFKPTQHRVSIPDAPLYTAPAKEYSPPTEYMTMEAFLRHSNRVVDTTLEDPIDPPAHAIEICNEVAIQGVRFPPGCYKFLARGYQAIALRVRHDDPTAAWSTYRHIAQR